jgi:hypothetical protein
MLDAGTWSACFLFHYAGQGSQPLSLLIESHPGTKSYHQFCCQLEWKFLPMLTVELFENLLGGFDAVVLGFLEDGNAAEVGIGEEDTAIKAR